MSMQSQFLIACTTCRLRKRKCDKRLPKCSLCARKDLHCDYNQQSPSKRWQNPEIIRHQNVFQQLPISPASLPQSLGPSTIEEREGERITNHEEELPLQTVEFPSVYFLDSRIFLDYHVEIPKPNHLLPTYVTSITGDSSHRQSTAKKFFDTVHIWMPIISKKRFYENVNSNCPLRADYALVVLCMGLISWPPGSQIQDARTAMYLAAKRYYLELEIMGVLSIQALQAGILIALFELGHAIYPSAFLSVATCARYGSALGLDWREAPSSNRPFSWVDAEEQNRAWWAIVILDRFINVGKPERPLIVLDPGSSRVFLPSNDTDWDQGIMPSKAIHSVTTSSIEWGDMGPFSLVAQATRLLGQVLRHISEPSNLDEEEAMLLDAALRALVQVVDTEGQLQELQMMNQKAICSMALIMLHEAHASLLNETETSVYFKEHHHALNCVSEVSRSVANIPAHSDQTSFITCVGDASPFLVTLLYLTATSNLRIRKENQTSESYETIQLMRMVLGKFDTRWKAAGAYLKVLEARGMACLK